MEYVVQWYDDLHPFFQNIIAASAFASSVLVLRATSKFLRIFFSDYFVQHQKSDLFRHLVHKELIKPVDAELNTVGYVLITIEAFRWVFRGVLTIVFFLGVSAAVRGDWWMLLGYWFLFNCVLEGRNWLKDMSSEKSIAYVKKELREEFFNGLPSRKEEPLSKPNSPKDDGPEGPHP